MVFVLSSSIQTDRVLTIFHSHCSWAHLYLYASEIKLHFPIRNAEGGSGSVEISKLITHKCFIKHLMCIYQNSPIISILQTWCCPNLPKGNILAKISSLTPIPIIYISKNSCMHHMPISTIHHKLKQNGTNSKQDSWSP